MQLCLCMKKLHNGAAEDSGEGCNDGTSKFEPPNKILFLFHSQSEISIIPIANAIMKMSQVMAAKLGLSVIIIFSKFVVYSKECATQRQELSYS